MNELERKLQILLTDLQIDQLRYAAGLEAEAQLTLTDILRGVVVLVRGADIDTRAQLEALVSEVTGAIGQGFVLLTNAQTGALRAFGSIAAQGVVAGLRALLGSVATVADPPNRLSAGAARQIILGSPAADWWAGQRVRMQQNFARELRQGYIVGDTTEDIARRLTGWYSRKEGRRIPGVIEATRRDARALVHTSVQSVAAEARREAFHANRDLVIGVRQVSTLDSHTTLLCMARDLKAWDNDRKPVGHNLPYLGGVGNLHWGCRSAEVPVLRGMIVDGKEVGGFAIGERASADGPVRGSIDYTEWLKSKAPGYIEDVLGPARAKLFRSGELTLNDLIDQRGNPLTLEQLRQKYGVST